MLDRIGIDRLRELHYRTCRYENTTKLKTEYGVELYEIRMLIQISTEAVCFIYEQEMNVPHLRLVYQKVA